MYKISNKDLDLIVSYAKEKLFYLNLPISVSGKDVDRGELPSIAILEALLMFLNSKNLLSEFVDIDYTEIGIDDCDMPKLEGKKK